MVKQMKHRPIKGSLTDKQRRFVLEYCIDFNATRAAQSAGYSSPAAMGCKLLNHPAVHREIVKRKTVDEKNLEIRKEDVLQQLLFALTREAGEFFNDDGSTKSIHEMSKRAQACIDGFEQEVFVNAETGDKTIRTKVKIAGKLNAVDLAMKHKGLFAAEKKQIEAVAKLDLSQLLGKPDNPAATIEAKILKLESEN